MKEFLQNNSFNSKQITYKPSSFEKNNLLHLRELGMFTALKPYVDSYEGLNSFLFFIVKDGKGFLSHESKNYCLSKGDCVFIDCSKAYSHRSSEESLWKLQWVYFFGLNLNGIYKQYTENGGQPVFTPKSSAPFSEIIDELIFIASSEDYVRDMKINEKLNILLTLIMTETAQSESNNINDTKKTSLREVKKYIEENHMKKITLDDLSDRFYINKFYLTRVFKKQFGVTLLSYLEKVRISHAKQLLRCSDLTVEEVGREVGISGGAYFNRVFKKVEGITPGEYRSHK